MDSCKKYSRKSEVKFHIIILRHYFARVRERQRKTCDGKHANNAHALWAQAVPAAHVVVVVVVVRPAPSKYTSRKRRTEQQKYFPTLAGEHLLDLSSIHDHPHHVCFQLFGFFSSCFMTLPVLLPINAHPSKDNKEGGPIIPYWIETKIKFWCFIHIVFNFQVPASWVKNAYAKLIELNKNIRDAETQEIPTIVVGPDFDHKKVLSRSTCGSL